MKFKARRICVAGPIKQKLGGKDKGMRKNFLAKDFFDLSTLPGVRSVEHEYIFWG